MDPDTMSVVRDIFIIVAAGALAAMCLAVTAIAIKLYRPLRAAAADSAETARNLNRISGDLAAVSEETAGNIAQTSRNLVDITEKAKDGTEELATVIHSARQASASIAAAAATAARIAEMVSRLVPEAPADGAGVSGLGALLRVVRGLFGGGRRREGDGGRQQGA